MDLRRRSILMAGIASMVTADLPAAAPAGRKFVIGVLLPDSVASAQSSDIAFESLALRSRPPPGTKTSFEWAFDTIMRSHGYIEGRNVAFERRYAADQYSRLPTLARELVGRRVDLIFAYGSPSAQAAREATRTTPIVALGLDAATMAGNFARPDGNLTGVTLLSADLALKRVEFLLQVAPHARRLGVFFNPDADSNRQQLELVQQHSAGRALEVFPVPVRNATDLERALGDQAIRYNSLYQCQDTNIKLARIAEFAIKHRIPCVGPHTTFVQRGGLIGFGVDRGLLMAQALEQVDRILNGAKPGDIPLMRPIHFELALNLKTAKLIGIALPKEMLMNAQIVFD